VIRAVVDTNVLVSGLLRPSGNEAVIILAIHQGLVRPCFSTDILDEYAAVLARPKFAFAPEEIAALSAMLRRNGEHFEPETSTATSPDPADTKFIECAEAAEADYIITGNKRDFPDAPYGAVRVVSAAELLHRIIGEM
jgi:putative PIN family toxin of toxin-antitoxin system